MDRDAAAEAETRAFRDLQQALEEGRFRDTLADRRTEAAEGRAFDLEQEKRSRKERVDARRQAREDALRQEKAAKIEAARGRLQQLRLKGLDVAGADRQLRLTAMMQDEAARRDNVRQLAMMVAGEVAQGADPAVFEELFTTYFDIVDKHASGPLARAIESGDPAKVQAAEADAAKLMAAPKDLIVRLKTEGMSQDEVIAHLNSLYESEFKKIEALSDLQDMLDRRGGKGDGDKPKHSPDFMGPPAPDPDAPKTIEGVLGGKVQKPISGSKAENQILQAGVASGLTDTPLAQAIEDAKVSIPADRSAATRKGFGDLVADAYNTGEGKGFAFADETGRVRRLPEFDGSAVEGMRLHDYYRAVIRDGKVRVGDILEAAADADEVPKGHRWTDANVGKAIRWHYGVWRARASNAMITGLPHNLGGGF
jgi:hypothetical protein